LHIFPYYDHVVEGNAVYLDGIQVESTSWAFLNVTPYDTEHINGVQRRTRSYVEYSSGLLDTSHGTLEMWVRPQTYSTSGVHVTLFEWGDLSALNGWSVGMAGDNIMAWTQVNDPLANSYRTLKLGSVEFSPNDQLHLVLTWDHDYCEMYFNGRKSTAMYHGLGVGVLGENNVIFPNLQSTMRFGAFTSPSYQFDSFDGYLDMIKIESCKYNQIHVTQDYKAQRVAVS